MTTLLNPNRYYVLTPARFNSLSVELIGMPKEPGPLISTVMRGHKEKLRFESRVPFVVFVDGHRFEARKPREKRT